MQNYYLLTHIEACTKLIGNTTGNKGSSNFFQKIMDTMLTELEFETAYLDDIVIKCKNREDHAKHVIEVFKNKRIWF